MTFEAEQPARRLEKTDRWTGVALVAAVVLAFGFSLSYGFLVDDRWIIRGNEAIRGWSSLLSLWTKPYWSMHRDGTAGLYRPLLLFLFAILWNAGLRIPLWFHLLAVVAHIIATLLLWRLLRRAVPRWPAALAALWFAVHPVHIEAVSNAANSAEVFATIATLTMALVVARAHSALADGQSIPWKTACVAAALYGVALLFKESGSTAPALALLVAWGWRGSQIGAPTVSRFHRLAMTWLRWRRLLITCGVVLVAVMVARTVALGSAVSQGSFAAPGLLGLTTGQRWWAMLSLGPKFLELLVWPRTLNPLYGPHTIAGKQVPTVAAAAFIAVVIVAIGVAAWLARRGDRRIAVGLAWIAVAFLPASNLLIPTGQILAERTLYLPSVGASFILAVALAAVIRACRVSQTAARRTVVLAVACCATVMVANETRRRSLAWRDHDAWFHQLVVANPDDPRAHLGRAVYLRSRGKSVDALAQLERGYRLAERDSLLVKEYATQLLDQRQSIKAARVASELMAWPERRRDHAAVRLYLDTVGAAYGADSVLSVAELLSKNAPTPTAWLYVGLAYEARRQPKLAISAYSKGLMLAGDDTLAMQLRNRIEALSH